MGKQNNSRIHFFPGEREWFETCIKNSGTFNFSSKHILDWFYKFHPVVYDKIAKLESDPNKMKRLIQFKYPIYSRQFKCHIANYLRLRREGLL